MRIKWHNIDRSPLALFLIPSGANKWHLQRKWWDARGSDMCMAERRHLWGKTISPWRRLYLCKTQHKPIIHSLSDISWVHSYYVPACLSSTGNIEMFKKTTTTISSLVGPTVLSWPQTLKLGSLTYRGRATLVGWRGPLGYHRGSLWTWVRWEQPEQTAIHLSSSAF